MQFRTMRQTLAALMSRAGMTHDEAAQLLRRGLPVYLRRSGIEKIAERTLRDVGCLSRTQARAALNGGLASPMAMNLSTRRLSLLVAPTYLLPH